MFREAAENYQLDIDGAFDWERINSIIHKTGYNKSTLDKTVKNKKPAFVFWCLLLVLIGWFAHYAWNSCTEKNTLQKNSPKNFVVTNKPGSIVQEINNKQLVVENKNIVNVSNRLLHFTKPLNQKVSNEKFYMLQPADKNIHTINGDDVVIKNIKMNENTLLLKPAMNEIGGYNNSNNQNTTEATNTNSAGKKGSHGFYAGLLVSPDLTFIKFQKTSDVGLSFGLTAGYSISSSWSIETGILLSKKNYYTKGEYFDKANVPSLQNVDLLSVEGNCSMFEIPINIRYTFNSKNSSNWVASLGTSSYFMRREYYDYTAVNNGANEINEHVYHTRSKNIFASLNLGAGYDSRISKTVNISIEPYYKIPLSGTGTGKLFFSSIGINLGITKKIY